MYILKIVQKGRSLINPIPANHSRLCSIDAAFPAISLKILLEQVSYEKLQRYLHFNQNKCLGST